MNEIIVLIGKGECCTDENGNEKFKNNRRGAYGAIKSVGQREFVAASQIGFKPEIMVEIWSFEYSGEEEVILGNKRYSIYRTYQKGDRLELYLTRRSGVDEN